MPSTRKDYNDLALTVMGIPFSPNWGTTPPFSLVTQELYDENKNKIVDEILKVFESFDPTTNKQYTQYIVKWFLVDESMAFPDIEDGRSTLKQAFDDFLQDESKNSRKRQRYGSIQISQRICRLCTSITTAIRKERKNSLKGKKN